jgi:hypothetical protein
VVDRLSPSRFPLNPNVLRSPRVKRRPASAWASRVCLGLQQFEHFTGLRETAELHFREDQIPVAVDFEDAA